VRSSGGGAGRAADIGFSILLRGLPRVNDWRGEYVAVLDSGFAAW